MLLLYLRSEGFRPEEYKVIIIIITITIIIIINVLIAGDHILPQERHQQYGPSSYPGVTEVVSTGLDLELSLKKLDNV